jgi:hypothetical protein
MNWAWVPLPAPGSAEQNQSHGIPRFLSVVYSLRAIGLRPRRGSTPYRQCHRDTSSPWSGMQRAHCRLLCTLPETAPVARCAVVERRSRARLAVRSRAPLPLLHVPKTCLELAARPTQRRSASTFRCRDRLTRVNIRSPSSSSIALHRPPRWPSCSSCVPRRACAAPRRIGPVEAHPRRALLQLLRPRQRRQRDSGTSSSAPCWARAERSSALIASHCCLTARCDDSRRPRPRSHRRQTRADGDAAAFPPGRARCLQS